MGHGSCLREGMIRDGFISGRNAPRRRVKPIKKTAAEESYEFFREVLLIHLRLDLFVACRHLEVRWVDGGGREV